MRKSFTRASDDQASTRVAGCEMKAGRNESRKKVMSGGAAPVWLLLPIVVLVVLKTNSLPQVTRLRQTSITEVADGSVHKVSSSDVKNEKEFLAMNGERGGSLVNSDVGATRSTLSCNFSHARMNICTMEGDVRMHGKAATVYVVSATDDSYWTEDRTVTIRPFPHKWEIETMKQVREVTIRSSAPGAMNMVPPRCTITHDVPAVVFSTPDYSKNFYHGMADIVVPLYNTTWEYNGRVHLLANDYNRKLIVMYRHILATLSIYPVIDFDADDAVRCFPSMQVGIESHKGLGIIPALSKKGYTMMDFRDFLRSAYSLKCVWATPTSRTSGDRPRLVMLLRRHSRALTNEAEAIVTATEVGFEVVVAGPEAVLDMAQFAEVVNSCDVMVGVHGAGLTNMVFFPHNGTLMQIVPWGEIKWPCSIAFSQPTPEMGLRYVKYQANAEETALKDIYPKDHAIFTDPISTHKQGFVEGWKYFLNGQNVTLDINRFKGVMEQIYKDITIT